MEIATTGEYILCNFNPVINEVYVLTVVHNSRTYTATERLKSVSPITKIVQNNEGGFTGKNIEIKTFYNDRQTSLTITCINTVTSISQ
jgi:hypothetical protein